MISIDGSENEQLQEVKEEISKNKTQTDLSRFVINDKREFLACVLDNLNEHVSNIAVIKWPEAITNLSDLDEHQQELFSQIETKLTVNCQQFTKFPNDYRHCLLSQHVYTCTATCSTINGGDHEIDGEASRTLPQLMLDDGWKVNRVQVESGFKAAIYINKKRQQLVLAFQGVKLNVKDFFLKSTETNFSLYFFI